MSVLREVLGNPLGEKNVAGVCQVHDSLSDVRPCTGDICFVIYVGNNVDGTAVNPHPQVNMLMIL